MARQFRLVIEKTGGPELTMFWHDDNSMERTDLPLQTSAVEATRRVMLWQALVEYCTMFGVDKCRCTRV